MRWDGAREKAFWVVVKGNTPPFQLLKGGRPAVLQQTLGAREGSLSVSKAWKKKWFGRCPETGFGLYVILI